jgi:hypothetical protein
MTLLESEGLMLSDVLRSDSEESEEVVASRCEINMAEGMMMRVRRWFECPKVKGCCCVGRRKEWVYPAVLGVLLLVLLCVFVGM